MCHKGQKIINKIASNLRGNEFGMYGHFTSLCEKPTPLGVGWIALNN